MSKNSSTNSSRRSSNSLSGIHAGGWPELMRQHDRLRLHPQPAVLGQNVELVHPVAERIAIGKRRRGRMRSSAETTGSSASSSCIGRRRTSL